MKGNIFYFKKLKAILSFIAALIILFTLCSCQLKPEKETDTETTAAETTAAETTAAETTASQSQSVKTIDLDALEKVENQDTSKVKIIKKEIDKDVIIATNKGGDVLTFTVENRGSSDVKNVKIVMVGYNAENGLVKVQPNLKVQFNNPYPYLQSMDSDTEIKAGSSAKVQVEVDADAFVGVKALVYSYTTSDGITVENDIYEEWVNAHQSNQRSVLD